MNVSMVAAWWRRGRRIVQAESNCLDLPSKSIIWLNNAGVMEEGDWWCAHWKRVKRGIGEESNCVKRVRRRGGVGLIWVLLNADLRSVGVVMVWSFMRLDIVA